MTLLISLILLALFYFNLFFEKLNANRLFAASITRFVSVEKMAKPIYFWLVLTLPALLIFILLLVFSLMVDGILGWLFVFITWLGVGYLCFNVQIKRSEVMGAYEAVQRDNMQDAVQALQGIDHELDEMKPTKSKLGLGVGEIFVWGHYRYVCAKLFYLMVGGLYAPVLLVVYTTACWMQEMLSQKAPHARIQQVLFILDWVPARLVACGYLLIGHFTRALGAWMKLVLLPHKSAKEIILEVAKHAIFSEKDLKEEPAHAIAIGYWMLASRTLIFILLLIALLTIFGLLA